MVALDLGELELAAKLDGQPEAHVLLADRVRVDAINASLATRGAISSFRFTRAGTYRFYCKPHSDFMTGTVVVT